MGVFDTLRNVVNTVTGGAAKVTFQLGQACVIPGEAVPIRITVTSTGGEVKSKGVYVDVYAEERVSVKDDTTREEIRKSKATVQQTIQIAPGFVLAPNETRSFDGSIVFPSEMQPTFAGSLCEHVCMIRGRIEAFGNDPDSGYQVIHVGGRRMA